LVRAPFSFEQLKSPWVIGSAAAGAGLNLALTRADKQRRGFASMGRMRYLGDSFNKEWGSAAYSAYWIPISIGAGVSEESLFRGMLQPEIERKWGDDAGLYTASGVFGLAHLDRPGSAESWAQVGFASAAGLFLGWRCRKKGNKLAEPIAAHAWFDIAAGLTLFFADPKENPLGAQVRYAF
jgi:membrane protease YdiL (CAAX protease family)